MTGKFDVPFGDTSLTIEIGKVAKQANASALVQVGGTVALVAVVAAPKPLEEVDFLPLTVDYREKFYASGRIPGGFIKRESRPGESETLKARLIDRPIRPLFPDGYSTEVQIYVTVLSMDQQNPAEVPALIGASTALYISDIPFTTPIAGVRIGMVDGEFIVNPTYKDLEKSQLDLVAAGTREAIIMVEAGVKELREDAISKALRLAHNEMVAIIEVQEKIRQQFGREKSTFVATPQDENLVTRVEALALPLVERLGIIEDKQNRSQRIQDVHQTVNEQLAETFPEQEKTISKIINELDKRTVRQLILDKKLRQDGRGPLDIRPITCEVNVLPRTHGSALFTRGQTQALSTVTLGTSEDRQTIDNLLGVSEKHFMLHYNFPSYSVGEVRPIRGPGRREIGHGALAERALEPVIPDKAVFPYTIRVVSEILESNGSSSMATVSSGTLSLMDAGVPIQAPVAGIAMGLVKESDRYVILTDIMGLEDHMGDMDLKVTGTEKGITALQMDFKTDGVTFEIIDQALDQARAARQIVLQKMGETLSAPRSELSPYAPRITTLHINPDRIRDLIGPAGKVIKEIIEKTGVRIDVENDGTVYVAAVDPEASARAIEMINSLTAEVELNKIYMGKVTRVTNFGAIVEIFPGRDGLVHISELDNKRIARVEDICRPGDTILVKVIGIDKDTGRVRLSRRAAMK
jgi:polyribonucleotide nucleotidyltransferase